MILVTIAGAVIGCLADRSSMWVPLLGSAVTVAAYVVARGVLSQAY